MTSDSSCQSIIKTCSNCDNISVHSWNKPCSSCLGDLTRKRLLITNQMDKWEPKHWIPRNDSSHTTMKTEDK